MVEVAHSLNKESIPVSVSNVVTRNGRFKEKSVEVNVSLKEVCREHNICLIYHTDTIRLSHLNRSNIYLNRSGSNIF